MGFVSLVTAIWILALVPLDRSRSQEQQLLRKVKGGTRKTERKIYTAKKPFSSGKIKGTN